MDFHGLTRKELQTLCKKNKIPANMTNVAMADALKALEIVDGIEECLNASQSGTAVSSMESPERAEVTSLTVPCTNLRTSTRRKPVKDESGIVQSSIRTRRATRRGITDDMEETMDNVSKTPAVRSSRRKAPASSACQKLEAQLKECEGDETSVKNVTQTPAPVPTSRRRGMAALGYKKGDSQSLEEKEDENIGGSKKACVVRRNYSTRRSVRLSEKKMESDTSVRKKVIAEPVKIDSFSSEMPINWGENSDEGSSNLCEVSESADKSDIELQTISEETVLQKKEATKIDSFSSEMPINLKEKSDEGSSNLCEVSESADKSDVELQEKSEETVLEKTEAIKIDTISSEMPTNWKENSDEDKSNIEQQTMSEEVVLEKTNENGDNHLHPEMELQTMSEEVVLEKMNGNGDNHLHPEMELQTLSEEAVLQKTEAVLEKTHDSEVLLNQELNVLSGNENADNHLHPDIELPTISEEAVLEKTDDSEALSSQELKVLSGDENADNHLHPDIELQTISQEAVLEKTDDSEVLSNQEIKVLSGNENDMNNGDRFEGNGPMSMLEKVSNVLNDSEILVVSDEFSSRLMIEEVNDVEDGLHSHNKGPDDLDTNSDVGNPKCDEVVAVGKNMEKDLKNEIQAEGNLDGGKLRDDQDMGVVNLSDIINQEEIHDVCVKNEIAKSKVENSNVGRTLNDDQDEGLKVLCDANVEIAVDLLSSDTEKQKEEEEQLNDVKADSFPSDYDNAKGEREDDISGIAVATNLGESQIERHLTPSQKPLTNTLLRKSVSKAAVIKKLIHDSDDKENIDTSMSGMKLVLAKEEKGKKNSKDSVDEEKVKLMHDLSVRQLRKMLKEKLIITNDVNSKDEMNVNEEAKRRPALQALPGNQLCGGGNPEREN